jgi:phage terminase large subunit-like protein
MLRITQRVVHCERTDGKVAVLAADSDTLDGWGGTFALVDELARHKSAENFGLLRDGLGPRQGQLVAFSTAGNDEESALGRLRAAAHDMGLEVDPANPKHRHVRRGRFAFHEWALANAEECDDIELVELANPASWLDRAELEARRDSPSMQKWQWQRFTCGLWVQGEESAISPTDWAACAEPGVEIPACAERVVVGVDIGYTRDCFAAVPAWKSPEDLIVLDQARVLVPPGDGTSIDIEDMVETCHAAAERWPGCRFAFDERYGGLQLAQRLEREMPTSEHITYPQDPRMMSGAAMGFAELISTRKLRHPDQRELTDHVLAAAARFVGGERWRFVKPAGRQAWIDAAIAAAMACDWIARDPGPPRSAYEDRGLLIV